MLHSHLDKEQLKGQLNKLMHLYLPSSNNTRFTNKLLISKITSPHTTNISFNQKDNVRCLHIKNTVQQIKNKNKKNDETLRLNFAKRSAAFSRMQMSFSARYSKEREQTKDVQIQESERIRTMQFHTLDKWRSLNATQRRKQKNSKSPQKSTQNSARISISRMLQQSTDRQTFNYITKFYKKPIQKQLLAKKTKKESKDISQVLNVSEYRPKTDQKSRYSKTIQPRCHCHKKSQRTTINNRVNYTSYHPRRKQINIDLQNKPKTSIINQRKTLVLSIPQNWTVDSWHTQSKNLNEQNGIQHGIFHQ